MEIEANMIHKDKVKNGIWLFLVFVLSFLMIFFFAQGDRELWQVPKEVGYRKGVFFSLLLIFVIRRVPIKKIETWLTAILGIIGLFIFHKVANYNTVTYGVDYFRVLLYTRMSYILSIALAVDLIRDFKPLIKSLNWIGYLFLIFAGWAVFSNYRDLVPLLCPAFAFITTIIDRKDVSKILDIIAIAYYTVFLYMMGLCVIAYPTEVAETGRYIGAFLSEATGTSFCGGALMIGLYFVSRFLWSDNRKIIKGIFAIAMAVATIPPIILMGSRSAQFGVIIALFGYFIFVIGSKTKKAVLVKVICAAVVVALAIGTVRVIASRAADEISKGEYDATRHSYLYNHIAVLMLPEKRSGYFGENSILNALDSFASERLKIWDASIKLAKPMGHPFEGIWIEWDDWGACSSTHSFFIWMLVTYGIIGGVFLGLWYLSVLGSSLVKCLKSDSTAILPFLWFLFCIGPFGGITMYWQAPISIVLLLIQNPLCHRIAKGKAEVE